VVSQASRLADVRYDIRGPVLPASSRARGAGARDHQAEHRQPGVVRAVHPGRRAVEGDRLHRGLPGVQRRARDRARRARRWPGTSGPSLGVAGVTPDDVYLGNGVSELIVMALQALLNPGDEVLVPSPDYPLWTGAVKPRRRARGALPVCRGPRLETRTWRNVESLVTPRDAGAGDHQTRTTRPGRSYSRETLLGLLDVARRARAAGPRRRDLRPDPVRRRGPPQRGVPSRPDLPVLTLGGHVEGPTGSPGFRSGWLVVSGPREPGRRVTARGLETARQTCGCARNVPGPARDPPPRSTAASTSRRCCCRGGAAARPAGTAALGAADRDPRGRLLQAGRGALTCFPRLDPEGAQDRRRPADVHRPA